MRPPAGARPAPGPIGRGRLVVPPRAPVRAVPAVVVAAAAGARAAAGVGPRVAPVLALVAPARARAGASAPPRPAVAARRRAAGAAGVGPGAAGRRPAEGARRQAAGAARGGRRGFLLRGAGPHVVHVLGHGGRGHRTGISAPGAFRKRQRRLGTTAKGGDQSQRRAGRRRPSAPTARDPANRLTVQCGRAREGERAAWRAPSSRNTDRRWRGARLHGPESSTDTSASEVQTRTEPPRRRQRRKY